MATVTTKKSGFREITGLDSDFWEKIPDPDHPGGTKWTSKADTASFGIKWSKLDEQIHGDPTDPTKPMKVGSVVKEWVDANGIRHAEIERIK